MSARALLLTGTVGVGKTTVAEAVGSEQTAARRMVVHSGGLPGPGNPVKLSGWADDVVRPPAPALDEHGAAVRAELA